MMMRHSRWSGRRIMPSGGGWMTPNPNGGVAACLVWNKDGRKQSDGHGSTSDVACSNADNEPQGSLVNPPTCRDVNVATSITVVPHQPTVVITPNFPCCCPRHNANTTRCSASSFSPSRSEATQQQKARLQHGPTKDQRQVDGCCKSGDRREEQCNAANENDDSCCLRRKTTTITTPHDDRRDRHINAPVTACRNEISATRDVDAERRCLQSAEISACRSRRPRRDSKVDIPAEPVVERIANSHRLRDIKYNRSTGMVAGSTCRDGRDPSAEDSHQQSAADFASCTDKMTTSIYASLAAFQDVHENDVIDAVRGYLRHQPTPSSSQRQRPRTGRRPTTAANGGGSRTVELRQGDVGPLSSLVVIRPAIPQPRTLGANGRPPALSDDRPKTAAEATTVSDDQHPALWRDRRGAQQQQQQRYVVQASSRTSENRTDCRRTCKSQLLNESIFDDGACGFLSSAYCHQ